MQEKTLGLPNTGLDQAGFAARVQGNQRMLRRSLQQAYDFIVCGSGSSGSVVARRLAENADANVLLLEAGGTDDLPQILDASRWRENLCSEQDWAFETRADPNLNGRSIPWAMGRVLGGSSSINAMAWARGHKNDWDFFATESGDDGWSYRRVLDIYREIENWQGPANPEWRGSGGLVTVHQRARSPLSAALFESCASHRIPSYPDQNGQLMESDGGSALGEYLIADCKRLSIFRSYTYPYMDRPNLTVLTHALVTQIVIEDAKAVGVQVIHNGVPRIFEVGRELILSLGAIHTPKVLMHSGIGDAEELRKLGIKVVQHLAGVGRNLQDHFQVAACVWEYPSREQPRSRNPTAGHLLWKSDEAFDTPDLLCMAVNDRFRGPATEGLDASARYWSIVPGLVRPQSRGRIHLTGPDPTKPVDIDAQILSEPADLQAAMLGVELCRDLGNSAAFGPFRVREIMPGQCGRRELERFVRDAAVSFYHYVGTAKMGCDEMSVVDGALKVHGIKNLRIADGSVMPRVTTGNTMAPCVIIGERAASMILADL
jgi:choline dehydrogenase